MSSVNKVILVGNLGKDPETRTFPSGDQVANVSIATTDKWKDKQSGEPREHTEWHRLVFNGRLAEIAAQYLRKGSQIYVEGQLRTRTWEQDGVKKYATEIRVDSMQMLGGRPRNDDGDDGYGDQRTQQQQPQGGGYSRGNQQAPQRQPQGGQRNSYADGRGRSQPSQPQRQQPQRTGSGFDDMDDDIPF